MRNRRREAGQALAEFGIVLPPLLLLVLGIIEVGYALFQVQIVTNLSREGSNLISRNTSIHDAETAINAAATTGPVRIDANTEVVFSIITLGTGGSNNNKPIIAQRHSIGGFTTANSRLGNPAQTAYGPSPDYRATDLNNDTSIQVSGPLPNGLTLNAGESVYVTEVMTKRTSIVPFIPLPATLYGSAYF
jgi:hypothetical protein